MGMWFNLYDFGTISRWCQQLTTYANTANAANTADHDWWELRWTEVKHCLLYNRFMKDLIEVQDLAVGGRVQHHLAGHLHGDHQEVGSV